MFIPLLCNSAQVSGSRWAELLCSPKSSGTQLSAWYGFVTALVFISQSADGIKEVPQQKTEALYKE